MDKLYENNSLHYKIKDGEEGSQTEEQNQQRSWKEDVEENSNSCNDCKNIQGEDLKSFKKEREISCEKKIDYSEGISICGNSKKNDLDPKCDELEIKSPINREELNNASPRI